MLAGPVVFGFAGFRLITTYMTVLNNGVELLSPQSVAVVGVLLLFATGASMCLGASGAAAKLIGEAKANRQTMANA